MTLKEAIDYLETHPYAEAYPHLDAGDQHFAVLRYPDCKLMQLCSLQDQKLYKIADISDKTIEDDKCADWYITDGLYISKDNQDARHAHHIIAE